MWSKLLHEETASATNIKIIKTTFTNSNYICWIRHSGYNSTDPDDAHSQTIKHPLLYSCNAHKPDTQALKEQRV